MICPLPKFLARSKTPKRAFGLIWKVPARKTKGWSCPTSSISIILAVEDVINEIHVPKVDDYGGYLYLVFHSLTVGDEPMDIHTKEIDVFVGPNYLVTVHEIPSNTINKMWNKEYHQERGLRAGLPCCSMKYLTDRWMAI